MARPRKIQPTEFTQSAQEMPVKAPESPFKPRFVIDPTSGHAERKLRVRSQEELERFIQHGWVLNG